MRVLRVDPTGTAGAAAAAGTATGAATVGRRERDIVHGRRRQTTQVVIILLHYQGWPSHAALEGLKGQEGIWSQIHIFFMLK